MTRIHNSAQEFGAALDRVVEKFGVEADTITRKALFDVANNIIDGTPHDTGRARAGWHITGRPSEWVPPGGSYGRSSLQEPSPSADLIYYLQNNVEYIVPLEDGWSLQAPRGMVATNISAYADYLNRHARDAETVEPG